MKRLIIILKIILITTSIFAQPSSQNKDTTLFKKNYLTGYFSYINGRRASTAYDNWPNYHEFTYRLEYAHRFWKQFIIGMDARYIRMNYRYGPIKRDFWIAGLTGKYVIPFRLRAMQIYFQTGLAMGNYCQCRDEIIPFKESNIWYVPYGAGFMGHFNNNFYIDVGLIWYRPFSLSFPSDPYAQYILGVGYNF